MAFAATLGGCADWPDLPDPAGQVAKTPPQLLPMDVYAPRLDDPAATAEALQARAAALQARADALRAAGG